MPASSVEYVDEANGVVRLRLSNPQIPDQFYYAAKTQGPIPDGDSPKIVVCNVDGSAKPLVTYLSGEKVPPYIGGHLEGFDEVATHFTWPAA